MRIPTVDQGRLPRFGKRHSPDRRMPERFEVLARFNSEVDRGITHTDTWRAYMALLQTEFDAWAEENMP